MEKDPSRIKRYFLFKRHHTYICSTYSKFRSYIFIDLWKRQGVRLPAQQEYDKYAVIIKVLPSSTSLALYSVTSQSKSRTTNQKEVILDRFETDTSTFPYSLICRAWLEWWRHSKGDEDFIKFEIIFNVTNSLLFSLIGWSRLQLRSREAWAKPTDARVLSTAPVASTAWPSPKRNYSCRFFHSCSGRKYSCYLWEGGRWGERGPCPDHSLSGRRGSWFYRS